MTSNTVVDALYDVLNIIKSSRIHHQIERTFEFLGNKKKVMLITVHRRESFAEGFKNICNAIKSLAEAFPEYNFMYPVHLNPNVQKPVRNVLTKDNLPNIYLIKPMEYLSFVYLMKKAHLILTDSGGIQEEAITFGKPTLVMRDTTERPEGVETGAVKLVGNKPESLFSECKNLLTNKSDYSKMAKAKNSYGDDKTAQRIVEILLKRL